jgi:hypothetical protein
MFIIELASDAPEDFIGPVAASRVLLVVFRPSCSHRNSGLPAFKVTGTPDTKKATGPRGLSQYDFYKYHYGVDPNYYGGRLPSYLNGGKGFSGKGLGFERYSNPGRTWARIPPIWKDYYAGVASGDLLGQLPQDPPDAPQ